MANERGLRARLSDVAEWSERLRAELAELPDTLAKLREGAANFQTVGQRLAESSSSLEELTQLYRTTIGEAVRRTTASAEELQHRVGRMPPGVNPPEVMARAASDLQRLVNDLAAMNPFWPPNDRR